MLQVVYKALPEFRMYKTAQEVQDYLTEHGAGPYTLLPSLSGIVADIILTMNMNLTIPSGTTLNLDAEVSVVINSGSTLTVDGALTGTGTLTNNGTLTVNSANTLNMKTIVNNGTLTNTASGRIVTDGPRTSATLNNAGRIEALWW